MQRKTQEVVTAFQASKLTQKAFCEKNSIGMSTLQYHLKKTRRANLPKNNEFIPIVPKADHFSPNATIVIINGRFSISQISDLLQRISR
jgi:hypothetical protein